MPIDFLPPADRDRLNHFPAQIPDDDLRAFFLLSEADQQVIDHQREAHTRLVHIQETFFGMIQPLKQ